MYLLQEFSCAVTRLTVYCAFQVDDIKNSQGKSIELSESGLRSGFGWIYIWVFWKLGRTFRDHFLRNFHEKMMFPKFIQDHSGMVPGASGHRKTFKNLQIFPWEGLGASGKNPKNSSENIVLNDFLDLFFQIFPCWRMYCPCGGTRGPLFCWTVTRRAYFLLAL